MTETPENPAEAALHHPRARQILLAAARRDRQLRATSREALVTAGRGVTQEPACRALPVDAISWTDAARAAVPKRGTR